MGSIGVIVNTAFKTDLPRNKNGNKIVLDPCLGCKNPGYLQGLRTLPHKTGVFLKKNRLSVVGTFRATSRETSMGMSQCVAQFYLEKLGANIENWMPCRKSLGVFQHKISFR